MPKTGNPASRPGAPPAVAVLAGGAAGPAPGYMVLAAADGSGFSYRDGTALTSREGAGSGGLRFFVRDLDTGEFWSPGRAVRPGAAQIMARGTPGVFILEHTENDLLVVVETWVLADRPAEIRRVMLTDLSQRPRRIDVTSLADVVLNHPDAHAAHPAFSKLFLQTEFHAGQRSLLVRRRPREAHETHPVLIHALLDDGVLEFETDRARFFGRGLPPARPAALLSMDPLSGTTGNVLDPVVSLRRRVELAAGGSAAVTFLLGADADAAGARDLPRGLDDAAAIDVALERARKAAEERLATLGPAAVEHDDAQHLAAAVLRGDPRLRAEGAVLVRAAGDPSDLVDLGIIPNRPLAVVQADAGTTERMLGIHRIWRSLGLTIQLVVLADDPPGPDTGAVHLRPGDLDPAGRDLLLATAALVVTGALPSRESLAPPAAPPPPPAPRPLPVAGRPDTEELGFFNGRGGFSPDGREYVVHVPTDEAGNLRLPPRPWTNVLANDQLGCIVSETGAGATWCGNSREHRLTPWFNDPLLDPHGDALYLRDEGTAAWFSCFPGPAPAGGRYEIRHGHGYTGCRRDGDDLAVETLVFVDRREPVRITRIRVTNRGGHMRRFSLFAYSQLVLGGRPEEAERFVVTSFDEAGGVMLARNRTAGPFAGHAAFAAIVGGGPGSPVHHTGDRTAFLGPGADPAAPAALAEPHLDGRTGAGHAPCFALQAELAVNPGDSAEIWVLLGQKDDREQALALVASLAEPGACEAAWRTTHDSWRRDLDGVKVKTPSPSLDLMVNGWLTYQTLACRMNGRSALYQSGGAYGFRDQLQDSLSLLALQPWTTRRQILLHAAHQFVEGDVLHWWHPPLSHGIRTRFADDLLWLPFASVEYIRATGDREILREHAPFLKGPALATGQDEIFIRPEPADEKGDLYDHCCRALDRSLTVGDHGLPLFGTGDWNDGMNRVGREGRGESVWMGFFLVSIIDGFMPFCRDREDGERIARYGDYRDRLIQALNDTGWDGGWYRRGYYDDGTPLGSWENKECAIDALAQAWSVLSGVATPARAHQAMDAVEEHLVDDGEGLIRLLTPPFVATDHDPGYIKGYVAGVRENGGQYTHAALWVVRAMAVLGRRERAAALLELINPVLHAATPEQVDRYQVEPYVMAADVYGAPPHVGRGGWTWYTGSSGWMLRVALESVLGLQVEGRELTMAPCVPDAWPFYTITWRVPPLPGEDPGQETIYEITVFNPDQCSETVVGVACDGEPHAPIAGVARLPLQRDGRHHHVTITLGPAPEART